MYLSALRDIITDRAISTASIEATTRATSQANLCVASGGIPDIWGSGYQTTYRGCNYPPQQQVVAAPQPVMGPITFTVPTYIATQISPQVSPVFVQQDEPHDSPVSAGTYATPRFSPGDLAIQQEIARQQMQGPSWLEDLAAQLEAEKASRDEQPQYPTYQSVPEAGAPSYAPPPSMFQQIPPLAWLAASAVGLVLLVRSGKPERK